MSRGVRKEGGGGGGEQQYSIESGVVGAGV